MISTAKHFPGHGATDLDSHNDLPIIQLSKSELIQEDLVPFAGAIKEGVQSVMIGHLEIPSLDTTRHLPATFSKIIIEGLLQKEMKFNGLIVTDAMNMRPITARYAHEEAARLAVTAGNDILLYPENEELTLKGLIFYVKSGLIPEERINRSVRKILAVKKYLGLFENRSRFEGGIDSKTPLRFAKDVAARSVTLLKDEKNIIPLNLKKYNSVACITIENSRKVNDNNLYFEKMIKEKSKRIVSVSVGTSSKERDYKKALRIAKQAQVVLIAAFVTVKSSSNSISLIDKQKELLEKITDLKKPVVLMSFGSPYLISGFPDVKTYLCSYGNPAVSQEAMLNAVTGTSSVSGILPVTIPGTEFSSGMGFVRTSRLYFDKTGSDTLYNFSKAETLINNAISDSAFPGAVLLVGYNGKVIYNKAFGSFTYDKKSKPVNVNSYFDIASLTKVAATTPAAMLLVDDGKIKLDDYVIKYLPAFNNNGKDKITIRNLLLHNSGLPAFKPFYKTCKNAREELAAIMNSGLEFTPGTKYLYSDLGMIVLQKIIEKISRQPLDRFLKNRLYDKLGMKNTFFNPPANKKKDCLPTEADNYWRNKLLQGDVHDETAYLLNGVAGNAGLFSTASDLAKLVNVLLYNGAWGNESVFKPETVSNWLTKQSSQSSRALGWDTKSDDKSSAGTGFSKNSFGHTGFTGTSIWADKDKKLFVILLTNRVHPSRNNSKLLALRPKIHDAVVEAIDYL